MDVVVVDVVMVDVEVVELVVAGVGTTPGETVDVKFPFLQFSCCNQSKSMADTGVNKTQTTTHQGRVIKN